MDDRDIAKRSFDLQSRARDYRLLDIPSYLPWSRGKLAEGVSEALIAHLDGTCMWLLPEEVDAIGKDVFDEMLEQLRSDVEG